MFVFGNAITNTANAEFVDRVSAGVDTELLDVEHVAYACVEDGALFLIHDAALDDAHGLIAPVVTLARRAGMIVDRDDVRESSQYLSGAERVRWFVKA